MSGKRKALTLEERVRVVERSRRGESARKIADNLGVGKTQIQTIIKDQMEVMRRWESGERGASKLHKFRKMPFDELNSKLWDFFCDKRARNIPLSGTMLQEQATIYAAELDLESFAASNGWLDRWKQRYSIKCSVISGESADVSEEVVGNWTARLASICEGYALADIFNADETGLFFRALPTRSLVIRGDSPSGVKVAKNRITALVAASAAGEKIKPMIIGKSAKPRCFQGVDLHSLGITYKNNKKAWMTKDIFVEWLRQVNNKMTIQNRKILMFVDNCSAHPLIELSNVKIVMLPPNTTSRLQPCDAGIIQSLKLNYRKRLLRHILFNMEEDRTATGPELASQVTLLDAVMWWVGSWENLEPLTIQKCFAKCGFSSSALTSEETEQQTVVAEETASGQEDFSQLLPEGVSLNDYANWDNEVQSTLQDDDSIVASEPEEAQSDEDGEGPPPISHGTAASHIRDLMLYSLQHSMPELAAIMNKAEVCVQVSKTKREKQVSIDSFFKRV